MQYTHDSFLRKKFKMTARKNVFQNATSYVLNREVGLAGSFDYYNALRRLDVIWPPGCHLTKMAQSKLFEGSLWKYPIFGSAFCPLTTYENILACASEEGVVRIWKIADYDKPVLLSWTSAHNNAIFDIAWHPQEKRLVTVSGDNSASLWDVGTSDLTRVQQYLGHDQTVKSCAFNQESTDILGTGDRNGCVYVWDVRTAHVENRINPAHERTVLSNKGKNELSRSSVTGLAFFENYMVTVSAGSARIKMWDLRKFYKVWTHKPHPVVDFPNVTPETMDGFSYLLLDHKRRKVYANCMNNNIYSYHLSSLGPKLTGIYKGLRNDSFYIKSTISPDGKYLLSGSCCGAALLWKTQDFGDSSKSKFPRPIGTLKPDGWNGNEINCVAWSGSLGNPFLIVTCPEYEPFLIWGIAKGDEHYEKVIKKPVSVKVGIEENVQELNTFITPNKRSLRAMLDNSPPESQSKKYKTNCFSRSIKLFPSSDVTRDTRDNDISSSDSTLCKPISHLRDKFNSVNISNSYNDLCDLENVCVVKDDLESVSDTKMLENIPFSPTSNLPNYAVDGTSPSHVCKPRRKENVDWLTKLRSVKKPDSIVKTVVNSSLRKQNEHVAKPLQLQHGSILKFFRVLGKSNDDRCKTNQGDSKGLLVKSLEQNNS